MLTRNPLSSMRTVSRPRVKPAWSCNLRSSPTHPQLQVSCAFAKICVAGLVLQLLKPSLNYRLAYSLIRKMRIGFLEGRIMLNSGFHKRRQWVRRIGSPNKLINYLKTVEFFALKISEFQKGKNSDSKKHTLSVQNLHMSRMFYI